MREPPTSEEQAEIDEAVEYAKRLMWQSSSWAIMPRGMPDVRSRWEGASSRTGAGLTDVRMI